MIVASVLEVVSIGAVVPFLGALTSSQTILDHPRAQLILQLFGVETEQQVILLTAGIFVFFAVTAGSIRLLLLYTSTRFSFAVGADISVEMYRRSLYQPYTFHTARNSSDLITSITGKSAMLTGSILMPFLHLASSLWLLGGVLLALLAINPVIAGSILGVFSLTYGVIVLTTKRRLQANGVRIAEESVQVIKALQEGFGGIRDVLINGTQEAYCHIYQRADRPLRLAQGRNIFISGSPRFIIEMIGMVLIAGMAYLTSLNETGVAGALPVLGALALGAQRLLPVLQLAYSSFTNIVGAQASLRDVLALLAHPMPELADRSGPALPLNRSIELSNVAFGYTADAPPVLRGIDLSIPKGSRFGFIGATGGGKSTMMDILMGLLMPTDGIMKIDGEPVTAASQASWRRGIAHVPQAIYLSDTSIAENIAFGKPFSDIDHDRVRYAAQLAQIADTIEGLPGQYDTKVGERGTRLSGGQRQRIGIARALYRDVDILILDEATSALDMQTERAVMSAIDGLERDLTVLIVAHRLSTLENCDQIVEIASGRIARQGAYEDLISS